MLSDFISQLDKLPAERTVKVSVVSDTGAGGGVTSAADSVKSSVDTMNKSMQSMPAVAEQTSSKVSTAMGAHGLSGAFSNTRSNLNSLTGGMMGFLPIMAGFSLVSAASQFEQMSKQVQAFAVASGTTAKVASDWVGVAGIYGLNANTLGLAIKGLQTKQVSLETTFNKTGSAIGGSTTAVSRAIEKYGQGSAEVLAAENAIKIARDKVTTTNIAYQVSTEKITTDQDKLTAAIDKYGKGSISAQTAEQALQTAQAHRITAQESVLKAQDAYAKSVGSTQSTLSTTQLAEQRLGVQLLDSKGKMIPATQILLEMADAYTKTGGSAQTVADITTILGGRAKAILPLFAEGSAGITQAIQQTQAAGGEMTTQQLKVGVAAGKMMNDIKANIKNMFVNLGSDLIPVFTFVDQHIKGIMQIAEAALGIFLAVKGIKFATGFISDVVTFGKSFKDILHDAPIIVQKVLNMATGGGSGGGGGGGGVANKIIGQQVTIALFSGAAMEQLKLVGGLGGGGSPINPKNLLGDLGGVAPTVATDTGVLAAGGLGAAGAGETSVMSSILASGAISSAAIFAAPAVATAVIAYFGWQSIVAEGKKTPGQQAHDAGAVRTSLQNDPGSSGSNHGNTSGMGNWFGAENLIIPKIHALVANVSDVNYQWAAVVQYGVKTPAQFAQFTANMPGLLKDTLQSGSNLSQATDDLGLLMQHGKIKNKGQLDQWENDWNVIQVGTGKNATYAQGIATRMEIAGTLTSAQIPAFSAAFNALVAGGLDPASLSAKLVAQEMATLAQMVIDAKNLLNADLQNTTIPAIGKNGKSIKLGHGSTGNYTGAKGGMLTEPILGVGQKTGSTYTLGEAGHEMLIPMSGLGVGSPLPALPIGHAGGGGGGAGVVVHVSFPNSLTFLNNANQIDQLAKAIESRLATVRLPHRGVRMSPH